MKEISEFGFRFSKNAAPVAHAADGEVVKFILQSGLGTTIQNDGDLLDNLDFDHCNGTSGPLFVDGAEPGDVLAVDILDVSVDDHGVVCTIEDMGPLWPSCELRTHRVEINADGFADYKGIKWRVEPMIGTIGCVTAGDDLPSCNVFEGGGNMDSRLITKGVTVWFPVRVAGALLAMGDLHASMADGEVIGTGIEIGGEVIVRVRLLKKFQLNWPVTETADAWYVNTCGATCDEAIERGYKEMQRLIAQAYGWDTTDTAMYMSIRGFLSSNQACLTSDEGGDTFRVGTPKVAGKPLLG